MRIRRFSAIHFLLIVLVILLGTLGIINLLLAEGTWTFLSDLSGSYTIQESTNYYCLTTEKGFELQGAINAMNSDGINPELNDAGNCGDPVTGHQYYHQQSRAIDYHIHNDFYRQDAVEDAFDGGFTYVRTGDYDVYTYWHDRGKNIVYDSSYSEYLIHADNR